MNEQVIETPIIPVQLSDEQSAAVGTILDWFINRPEPSFKLGGYAGTGKTTVIKHLLKECHENTSEDRPIKSPSVCAFTGKAVNVLNRKGVYGQTLHSLMYNCEIDSKTGECTFYKRDRLEGLPDFVIVDESSMLSTELYKDLSSFNIKTLFVGDPGQLEPVGDNPNLMAKPDLVLSKIHRQAEHSPIITLANSVRLGGPLPHQASPELTIRRKELKCEEAVLADQIICAKNKTRTNFNDKIREHLQLPSKQITKGEKIICLRNNLNFSVFNGQIFFIDEILFDRNDHWLCNVHDESGKVIKNLPIWKKPFVDAAFDPKNVAVSRKLVYCDYGYVITCHKSQGSEWDSVLVIDEWMPPSVWDMRRWRYTAITRAAKKLTYLI